MALQHPIKFQQLPHSASGRAFSRKIAASPGHQAAGRPPHAYSSVHHRHIRPRECARLQSIVEKIRCGRPTGVEPWRERQIHTGRDSCHDAGVTEVTHTHTIPTLPTQLRGALRYHGCTNVPFPTDLCHRSPSSAQLSRLTAVWLPPDASASELWNRSLPRSPTSA